MIEPFLTVIMDPPWPENGGGGRGASHHYGTVPYSRIPEVVLRAPCWPAGQPDMWIGVWSTVMSEQYAMALLEHVCGARYVTRWTWVKTTKQGELSHGMGQYGRHAAEFILWGKRGRIGRKTGDEWKRATAVFEAPVGEHSEKPAIAYENARKVFPGPRLAMFERQSRPGFTCWGDQLQSEPVPAQPVLECAPGNVPPGRQASSDSPGPLPPEA